MQNMLNSCYLDHTVHANHCPISKSFCNAVRFQYRAGQLNGLSLFPLSHYIWCCANPRAGIIVYLMIQYKSHAIHTEMQYNTYTVSQYIATQLTVQGSFALSTCLPEFVRSNYRSPLILVCPKPCLLHLNLIYNPHRHFKIKIFISNSLLLFK